MDLEPDVSSRTTGESNCGRTRTTRRVTWEMSGRSPLLVHRTPRALCLRRCENISLILQRLVTVSLYLSYLP